MPRIGNLEDRSTTAIHLGKQKVAYKGKFNTVTKIPFINTHSGKKGVWEVVKRKNAWGPIVGMIAVTEDLHVILTKIYRIPFKAWVVSFPCGAVLKNEGLCGAARRELREETGFNVYENEMTRLFEGPFNPALVSDTISVYAGFDAKQSSKPQLDSAEDIEVLTLPLKKAVNELSLASSQGVLVDVKVYAAIYGLQIALARQGKIKPLSR